MSGHKNYTMSREQVIETMRYLGWITHDQQGTITDEAFHVAGQLAGKITYGITTPSDIASAVDKYRADKKLDSYLAEKF